MRTKHTPGPWEAVRYESEVRESIDGESWNGYHIKQPDSGLCDVAYVDDVDFGPEIAEANARLIAAAPEMLAALKYIARFSNAAIAGNPAVIRKRAQAAIRATKCNQ